MVPGQKEALNNWLYCAQMSNKNKDYDEAIVSYKKLMVYNPENMDLQLQLAGVYENKKQYDTVVTMMNALIAKDAQNAAAYSKLGEIYGKIYNQIDKSLGFLLKAYSISPSDASTLENIGIAYGIKKDYRKSIEFFMKSLEVRPENAQVYMNMGGTYINMGDKAKAQKCFEKAAEINSVK